MQTGRNSECSLEKKKHEGIVKTRFGEIEERRNEVWKCQVNFLNEF